MIVGPENSTKLEQLDIDQLRSLSLEELVGRMESVRHNAWRDRHNTFPNLIRDTVSPYTSLIEFITTKRAQEFEENERRRLAYFVFQFLFQSDLITTTSGISNQIVFETPYDEDRWSFPRQWFRHSALEQYQIISSRILLERFFFLIYFVSEKKMLEGKKKSNFGMIRDWVVKPDNPFQCFIPDLIDAYKYDRVHRNKEIHGASAFVKSTLRLEVPTQTERSVPYPLAAIVHKLYNALLKIMDYQTPATEGGVNFTVSGREEVINQFRDKDDPFVRDLTKFATNHGLKKLPEMVMKKKSEMNEAEKQRLANAALIFKL